METYGMIYSDSTVVEVWYSENAVARVYPQYAIIAVPAIVFLFLSSFVDIYKNL